MTVSHGLEGISPSMNVTSSSCPLLSLDDGWCIIRSLMSCFGVFSISLVFADPFRHFNVKLFLKYSCYNTLIVLPILTWIL